MAPQRAPANLSREPATGNMPEPEIGLFPACVEQYVPKSSSLKQYRLSLYQMVSRGDRSTRTVIGESEHFLLSTVHPASYFARTFTGSIYDGTGGGSNQSKGKRRLYSRLWHLSTGAAEKKTLHCCLSREGSSMASASKQTDIPCPCASHDNDLIQKQVSGKSVQKSAWMVE